MTEEEQNKGNEGTNYQKKGNNKLPNNLTGIKAVLEQSLQSYDKLPMLEIIFEKFI